MRFPAGQVERQIISILSAWGMEAAPASLTAQLLVAADLRGIDSHGIAALPLYDELRRMGRLNFRPAIGVVRDTAAIALLDGGGGLGHVPSHRAILLAVKKCQEYGVGAVAVRNSHHFGAAGVYALLAAERDCLGLATTAVWRPSVVPTFAAEPMFGTNPIAFAAPAGTHPPFCLDIATSTVAIGKLRLAALRGESIPHGWAVGPDGQAVTDPVTALQHRLLTPLGGTPVMSSHKGYGLAAMVEILCTVLSASFFAATRPTAHPDAATHNVGHFFLAVDPKFFRETGAFQADLDDMIDALRNARRAEPGQPVLVPGDPEQAAYAERTREGIPLGVELRKLIESVAEASGAPFILRQGDSANHGESP